jgi:enediyne biosynthesis protein E4
MPLPWIGLNPGNPKSQAESSMTHIRLSLVLLCFLIPQLLSRVTSTEGKNVQIKFKETALESGLRAEIICGGPEKRWIPEANGGGAAALDYDQDGWMDLLLVNGSTIENLSRSLAGAKPSRKQNGVYLFRNLGGERFQDVTAQSNLSVDDWGTGANVADYDNDGDPDILITTIGVDLLFRNDGKGRFTEVGRQAGLRRTPAWHTGSAFGDYDNDGDLDLYIAGYVSVDALKLNASPPVCQYRSLNVFCGPKNLKGEPDVFYRNNGDGSFTEATAAAGLVDLGLYYGFTPVFDDFNGDGRLDLFVANDSCPNYLYLNQGNGAFKESGLMSGVAVNASGQTQANMGVAVGDYDRDGDLDLLTTTFSEDYFPLYAQQPGGLFEEIADSAGLAAVTTPWLGWACGFNDLDNDGDPDLWLSNGHIYPQADRLASTTYHQPFVVLENHAARFLPVADLISNKPAPNSYRGACAADFNNDGRIDLAVLPIAGNPLLLLNQTNSEAKWIGLELRGRKSNRNAVGAKITLESCGRKLFETVRNGGSYLSRNDPRIHFGLGSCRQPVSAIIVWPSGKKQMIDSLKLNQYVRIEE